MTLVVREFGQSLKKKNIEDQCPGTNSITVESQASKFSRSYNAYFAQDSRQSYEMALARSKEANVYEKEVRVYYEREYRVKEISSGGLKADIRTVIQIWNNLKESTDSIKITPTEKMSLYEANIRWLCEEINYIKPILDALLSEYSRFI